MLGYFIDLTADVQNLSRHPKSPAAAACCSCGGTRCRCPPFAHLRREDPIRTEEEPGGYDVVPASSTGADVG